MIGRLKGGPATRGIFNRASLVQWYIPPNVTVLEETLLHNRTFRTNSGPLPFAVWVATVTGITLKTIFPAVSSNCGGIMEIVGWWTILPGVIDSHELWLVAVLMGAILHWLFIWQSPSGDR